MYQDQPTTLPATNEAKRLQILEGARSVFLAQGFDAASMEQVARAAGVSKGTLYVYFQSKQALFSALVREESRQTAERLFELQGDGLPVREVLTRLGDSFIAKMLRPDHVALMRMVIAVAPKFPEVGEAQYEAGPCYGRNRLAAYLATQVEAGRLAIDDLELAAAQFLSLCHGPILYKVLMAVREPDAQLCRRVVDGAVTTFMAAYGTGEGLEGRAQ